MTSPKKTTALVAEDEPLLRRSLIRALAEVWPDLDIVAEARHGREAVDLFEANGPDVCFLDIHMPELSGLDAATFIGDRAHVVFVTAYDEYAVKAFEQGAIDYLVKPVEPARLATTAARLRARLDATRGPGLTDKLPLLRKQLHGEQDGLLRWLHVSVGRALKLVAIDEIDYARSDEKYTVVAWHDDEDRSCEGLIRTPLKELIDQLDSRDFAQIHRSYLVNLRAIDYITRDDNGTAKAHLKRRQEALPISRAFQKLFRQM